MISTKSYLKFRLCQARFSKSPVFPEHADIHLIGNSGGKSCRKIRLCARAMLGFFADGAPMPNFSRFSRPHDVGPLPQFKLTHYPQTAPFQRKSGPDLLFSRIGWAHADLELAS